MSNIPNSKASGIYTISLGDTSSEFPLYLHENDQGELVGHFGPLTFHGRRSGTEATLTVTGMELKELEAAVQGAARSAGELKLTLANGTWTGTGTFGNQTSRPVSLARTADLPSHVAPDQLVHRAQLSVESTLCSILNKIVSYILDALEIEIGESVRPMSACGPRKNGRGFYLLGDSAPGGTWPPVFLQTIYFPWDSVSCGKTSHDYNFSINLGDYVLPFDQVLSFLRTADSFLHKIGIDIDSFVNELQNFINSIGNGKFAFSFIFSTYTRNAGIVFNNEMGITGDQMNSYPLIQTLQNAFSRLTGGHTIYLYGGTQCSDSWSASNGFLPAMPCNSPFWMVYLFGTAGATYN